MKGSPFIDPSDQKKWDRITKKNGCSCKVDGQWYCDDHFKFLGVESKIWPEPKNKTIN